MRKVSLHVREIALFVAGLSVGFAGWQGERMRMAEGPPPLPTPADAVAKSARTDGAAAMKKITDAFAALRVRHVSKDTNDEALADAAVRAMVAEMHDPYTRYLPPAPAALHAQDTEGSFFDIGIGFRKEGTGYVISQVLENSTAEDAGLLVGDLLLSVDGVLTDGVDDSRLRVMLRGVDETPATIGIRRDGADPMHVSVPRDEVVIDTVTAVRNDDGARPVLHLLLSGFNENTDDQLGRALREANDVPYAGIVLDLRDNGGGLVHIAKAIACRWIGNGMLVHIEVQRDGTREEEHCDGGKPRVTLPTAVLTNGNTASAAEILTAALRDNNAARVVGQKTFGKGLIQAYTSLGDGSLLAITMKRWLTPKGAEINRNGIVPDVPVEPDWPNEPEGGDAQLRRAVELLVGPRK